MRHLFTLGIKKRAVLLVIPFILSCIVFLSCHQDNADVTQKGLQGISIYKKNPFYWQYNGKPLLLIGGSSNDNLFQIPKLQKELEQLKVAGGNYLRCTMSSRDSGNVWAYMKNEHGKYNLEKPNPEYWDRLEHFLELTGKMDIIVQIEFWATYDFYDGQRSWKVNPYNPSNNVNYNEEKSGLPSVIDHKAWEKLNPFFLSVPKLDSNSLILRHQQKFFDKIVDISLPHDHVLYTIDNETHAPPEWGIYWANYLRNKAENQAKDIYITEMWDNWDPTGGNVPGIKLQTINDHPYLHRSSPLNTINHPETYNFIDVSNHNTQLGQVHYETGLWVREHIARKKIIRPVNNVKIYGGPSNNEWNNDPEAGKQRFLRNLFAGHAAVRFHRPPAGIGLSAEAQNYIKSARAFFSEFDIFSSAPDTTILRLREANEGYALKNEKNQVALYFPGRHNVSVIHGIEKGKIEIRTLDIEKAQWTDKKVVNSRESLVLKSSVEKPVLIILTGRN